MLFVTVHDASALVAESGEESEDEWNYFKGDSADKENFKPSDTDAEVRIVFRNIMYFVYKCFY